MAEPEPSRSTTFLTGLTTLLLVVGVAIGVYVLGGALIGRGNDELAVHQTVEPERLADLPPSVVRPNSVPVTVRIPNSTHRQKLLAAGRDVGPIVLTLAILWLVRGVLRSVRDGDPFIEDNVRRLRTIGLLCVFGIPAVTVLTSEMEVALAASSTVGELGNTLSLSAGGPLIGLGVFVLAEIFARAVRLRLDVEGTV